MSSFVGAFTPSRPVGTSGLTPSPSGIARERNVKVAATNSPKIQPKLETLWNSRLPVVTYQRLDLNGLAVGAAAETEVAEQAKATAAGVAAPPLQISRKDNKRRHWKRNVLQR